MKSMFGVATSFNQDISGWNTAAGDDMSVDVRRHFLQPAHWQLEHGSGDEHARQCSTAPLPSTRTSASGTRLGDEHGATCSRTPLPSTRTLASWDTAAVTNMERMFYQAAAFNQDLSGWKVGAIAGETSCDKFCFGAPRLSTCQRFLGYAVFSLTVDFPDACRYSNRDPRPRRNRERARHALSRHRQHPTINALYRFRT